MTEMFRVPGAVRTNCLLQPGPGEEELGFDRFVLVPTRNLGIRAQDRTNNFSKTCLDLTKIAAITLSSMVASQNGLSQRGQANVDAIMPKIKGAVEERKVKHNKNIDLSTSENWLIRPELIEICKEAIAEDLVASVGLSSIIQNGHSKVNTRSSTFRIPEGSREIPIYWMPSPLFSIGISIRSVQSNRLT
jgi:phage-related tail fiber protein